MDSYSRYGRHMDRPARQWARGCKSQNGIGSYRRHTSTSAGRERCEADCEITQGRLFSEVSQSGSKHDKCGCLTTSVDAASLRMRHVTKVRRCCSASKVGLATCKQQATRKASIHCYKTLMQSKHAHVVQSSRQYTLYRCAG